MMKLLGVPRRLAVGVVVLVAAAVLAGYASANNRPAITFVSPPSPTEGQTLTTDSVQFQFTFNRQPKAAASLQCVLSGPTPSSGPCNAPVSSGQQQSTSGASYSSLANGAYTFTVSLTLTDGGTATAVLHFTVNACTTGSEDFSEDAEFSQPTTFSGGTIDTAYGNDNGDAGGVRVDPSSWFGWYPDGTHVLFTGDGTPTFQLTFTKAVGSVQLDPQQDFSEAVTLTAYDAANNQVGTDTNNDTSGPNTLTVTSTSNNIKYFTVSSGQPPHQFGDGVGFTNIVWGCN
jgi:hypothetical protein